MIKILKVLSLIVASSSLAIWTQALPSENNASVIIEIMNNESFFQMRASDWKMVTQLESLEKKLVNTAFQWAVRNGRLEVFTLLWNDSRVEAGNGYYSALTIASKHGHSDIVEILLKDEKFDHNTLSEAYNVAVGFDHVEVVKLLLKASAELEGNYFDFVDKDELLHRVDHEVFYFFLDNSKPNWYKGLMEYAKLTGPKDEHLLQAYFKRISMDSEIPESIREAFKSFAEKDYEKLEKSLLKLEEEDRKEFIEEIFQFAFLNDETKSTQLLLDKFSKHINVKWHYQKLIFTYFSSGNFESARIMLQYARENFPESKSRVEVEFATLNGNITKLKELLKDRPSVDDVGYAFMIASVMGNLDALKLLHKIVYYGGERSGEFQMAALFLATVRGQFEVFKFVRKRFEGLRVAFGGSVTDDYILLAALYGHENIFKCSIYCPLFDVSNMDNFAIRFASRNGHTEIVRAVLEVEEVDPSDIGNYAIRMASKNGHTEIVKMLLEDYRVDPSVHSNFAINQAFKNGHYDIVKILLQDERVKNVSIVLPQDEVEDQFHDDIPSSGNNESSIPFTNSSENHPLNSSTVAANNQSSSETVSEQSETSGVLDDPGMIAIVVLGSAFWVILISGVAIFYIRRRRSEKRKSLPTRIEVQSNSFFQIAKGNSNIYSY